MRPKENKLALSTTFLPETFPHVRKTGIEVLTSFSEAIGRDVMLTQGSTGNTSIKIGGVLWIKASGTWLQDAGHRPTFVALDLGLARDCVWRTDSMTAAVLPEGPPGLQPSIESGMHAVLPHRVVAHIHSVHAIAAAVCARPQQVLQDRLSGISWEWIPYVPSGLPLACQVMRAVERSGEANVFVLGNHGLTVCGNTVGEVESLIYRVHDALAVPPRAAPPVDASGLQDLAAASGWILPDRPIIHSLAMDPASRSILSRGVLYPCQEIFLGGSRAWNTFATEPGATTLPFLIIPERGVLISPRMTTAEYLTLAGLAEIVQRINPSAPLNYLSEQQVTAARALGNYKSQG